MSETPDPQTNDNWSFRPMRGVGTFTVIDVVGGRVVLRPQRGDDNPTVKDKTISVKTLKKDYRRISGS